MTGQLTDSTVTDAQLVALAERLGWRIAPGHPDDQPPRAFAIQTGEGWLPLPVAPREAWILAGAIQAAMAGLGYECELYVYPDGSAICHLIHGVPGMQSGRGESLNSAPDAIVLAACAALGVPS